MQRIIRNVIPAALAAGALGLLAACSSGPTTGTQTFSGTSSNPNSSVITITGTGVVADHGTLNTGSNGSTAKLMMSDGTVDISHTKGNNNGNGTTTTDQAACTATNITSGTYNVTGGTGTYSGATGHGGFKITFKGSFLSNGKCNLSPNASPVSGTVSFLATGPLSVGG